MSSCASLLQVCHHAARKKPRLRAELFGAAREVAGAAALTELELRRVPRSLAGAAERLARAGAALRARRARATRREVTVTPLISHPKPASAPARLPACPPPARLPTC
jgi:hypothetical protein